MALVMLTGAHLYKQALGNSKPPRLRAGPPLALSLHMVKPLRDPWRAIQKIN